MRPKIVQYISKTAPVKFRERRLEVKPMKLVILMAKAVNTTRVRRLVLPFDAA
jgi:hypothetical protein